MWTIHPDYSRIINENWQTFPITSLSGIAQRIGSVAKNLFFWNTVLFNMNEKK